MILEALAAYLWLYEPLPSQKEDAARDLMAVFAHRWVREEDRRLLMDAACTYRPGANPSGMTGMGGREIAVVECRYRTSCGTEMVRPIWHEPILGAYTTADTVAEDLAWECPEMLLPAILAAEQAEMEQGG